MKRLTGATLHTLPVHVSRPSYALNDVVPGIVHLGVGAFHRAHQAVYTDAALERGDRSWGIIGASLRSTETRDALAHQDFLFTVVECDGSQDRHAVIGALRNVLVAPENASRLIAAMSHDAIKIVSLTVTEKGYCHDPSTGELIVQHPDILHDLKNPDQPCSAPGYIVAALRQRIRSGIPPFTVLSCDNLPANGKTARHVITQLASLFAPDLGKRIADSVAFPSSMVDRIVPATTEADRDRVALALGLEDAWPVMTEPYAQWVIEDDFPQGRPDWQATFVRDVTPFETMKLRLLNGAHSSIAYLGYLAGYQTVAEAMANPALAHFVTRLMHEEVTPVLKVPPQADLEAYKAALLARFRNPALQHRTWQIAMDGSQKLPQRLLGTIRDRLARGMPIDCLSLSVAAWMRYVTGLDERGGPIDVRDPLSAELRKLSDAAGLNAERLAPALLGCRAAFGTDLPMIPQFVTAVTLQLQSLIDYGSRATLDRIMRAST